MSEENFFCSYCDEGFEEYEELEKHIKVCSKKPKFTTKLTIDEEGKKKELPIVVYKQDPSTVDKNVLYSNSDVTVRHLIQTLEYPLASEPGAYRKRYNHCPHCKYKMDEDKWAKPPNLVEVCLAQDMYSWDNSQLDQMITFISECPKCGIKSIRHFTQYQIFRYDWIDHRKIIDTLVKREVVVEGEKIT